MVIRIRRQPPAPDRRRRGAWRWAARTGASLVSAITFMLATSPAWAAGPSAAPSKTQDLKVNPAWGDAPGEAKIQMLIDFAAKAALYCSLFAILAGAAAIAVGKLFGSTQSGNRGAQFVLGGGAAALLVKFAPSIINWLIA